MCVSVLRRVENVNIVAQLCLLLFVKMTTDQTLKGGENNYFDVTSVIKFLFGIWIQSSFQVDYWIWKSTVLSTLTSLSIPVCAPCGGCLLWWDVNTWNHYHNHPQHQAASRVALELIMRSPEFRAVAGGTAMQAFSSLQHSRTQKHSLAHVVGFAASLCSRFDSVR